MACSGVGIFTCACKFASKRNMLGVAVVKMVPVCCVYVVRVVPVVVSSIDPFSFCGIFSSVIR